MAIALRMTARLVVMSICQSVLALIRGSAKLKRTVTPKKASCSSLQGMFKPRATMPMIKAEYSSTW